MDADLEYDNNYYINYTYTLFPNGSRDPDSGDIHSHNTSSYGRENNSDDTLQVISISMLILLGVVGNGIVIWLLGFCVQRNPFMTFILNLAIADLGLLISILLFFNTFEIFPDSEFTSGVFLSFFSLMNNISQFLLTAISIDRCVAVFFPFWHHCHRPPCLSAIVCALIWVLSILLATFTLTPRFFDQNIPRIHPLYQFIVNAVLCLPLMTISTVSLFIKVCFKPRQHQRGKLLTILLLTLFFFLLFGFPLNVIVILVFLIPTSVPTYFLSGAMLLSCLNSSVNPVIYFLVGRQRKARCRESLKMILQRAFKEEEGCIERTPEETQL